MGNMYKKPKKGEKKPHKIRFCPGAQEKKHAAQAQWKLYSCWKPHSPDTKMLTPS